MSVDIEKTTTVKASVATHWQGGDLRSFLRISRNSPYGPVKVKGTGVSGSTFTLELTDYDARDLAAKLLEVCDWTEETA